MGKKIISEVNSLLNNIQYTSGAVAIDKIAEFLKIKVCYESLSDNVSGVLDCRQDNLPIILINKDHHLNRKRFSLAHEIGHFVLHKFKGIHMDNKVFFRADTKNLIGQKMEREANLFAAEILMPAKQVQEAWSRIIANWVEDNYINKLAQEFQVSGDAMLIRLKEMKGLQRVW